MLFYKTDFSEIFSSLKKANYLLIAPAIAVYFVSFWFKVARWSYIIGPLKAIPAGKLFSINVIGYMVNNILPGRIGELVRAYLVGRKERLSKSAILGTIVVERVFDGLALIFIILLFSFLLPLGDLLTNLLGIMIFIFLGLLLFFVLIVAFPASFKRSTAIILNLAPEKLRITGEKILAGFAEGIKVLNNPGRMAVVFTYSVVLWTIEAITGSLIGIAFGFKIPLMVYFVATGAANLATILPTTQGGIGPYEFFAKQTLVLFGADNSSAVAYAIVLHALLILPLVFLGFIYLWFENLSLFKITESSLQHNAKYFDREGKTNIE